MKYYNLGYDEAKSLVNKFLIVRPANGGVTIYAEPITTTRVKKDPIPEEPVEKLLRL